MGWSTDYPGADQNWRATCYVRCAGVPRATCYVLRADVLRATCYVPGAEGSGDCLWGPVFRPGLAGRPFILS
jgi:hypothetical protein